MSEQGIYSALIKLFQEERVVFWYDDAGKLKEEFHLIELSDVEKIEVNNNEFFLKYRIILEDKQKFLLYFTNGEPPMQQNWLLDLQLAHRVFNSDQESLFLQEAGLDYSWKYLVKDHAAFFESKERRSQLKELVNEKDGQQGITYKMLSVVFSVDYVNLEAFIQTYAGAFINNNHRYEKALARYNLNDFFWREIQRKFNYQSDKPSIYDFLLDVFSRNFTPTAKNQSAKESRILISLWKDTVSHQEAFQAISNKIVKDLQIEQILQDIGYESLLNEDVFRVIDLKIIHDLIQALLHESVDLEKVERIIKKRQNKYWFEEFKSFYKCVKYAANMIDAIRNTSAFKYDNIEEGCAEYAKTHFWIDIYYRKFVYHYRQTNQNSVLSQLYDKVHKVYSNDWLLASNDDWQNTINNLSEWPNTSSRSQRSFFSKYVEPHIKKGQRLFVVISDALRYENGWELCNELQSEKRYEAEIDHLFTSLPSYTQLGMAALLPHNKLEIVSKDCSVNVDDLTSMGIAGRSKILQKNAGVRATAIQADDFLNLNAITEGRAFAKEFDLIYVYHNHIDDTGDSKTSETSVFNAVEDEIDFLKKLLRHISNVNGNKIIITADHGYIYQHESIEESDFSEAEVQGEVWKTNRRFVLGTNLQANKSAQHFTAKQMGLEGNVEMLIPKSINRMRVRGAGSRFVHGGASLQEIVVPVLSISKKRRDTTSQVDVEIIKSTDKITTNILHVQFIQTALVTDKLLPRIIRAQIFAPNDEPISDTFNFKFDIREGTERNRAIPHNFQLSAAASGKYRGQRVQLRLEEPVEGSNKWKTYAEHNYTLNISFMNDFSDI